MRMICIVLMALSALCIGQEDADTYLKVEKARAEVPACKKVLESSTARGSVLLNFMPYSQLDKFSKQLEHCGFVFMTVGDNRQADRAGDEGNRYDAAIGLQMESYLKAKNLWADFVRQDCRMGSSECGKNKK